MSFDATIYLPPRGRGTTEVVEGACAIKLLRYISPKAFYMVKCILMGQPLLCA